MDTVMSDEKLRSIFDLVVREVTEKLAGIRLYEGSAAPVGKDSCTVHATFARGFSSSLALCADTAMFIRLTQSMLQEEKIRHGPRHRGSSPQTGRRQQHGHQAGHDPTRQRCRRFATLQRRHPLPDAQRR